jgi:hypothetical protein
MKVECFLGTDGLFHVSIELTLPKTTVGAPSDLTITEDFVVDTGSPRSFLSSLKATEVAVKLGELPDGELFGASAIRRTATKRLQNVKMRMFYDNGKNKHEEFAELLILREQTLDNILGMDLIPLFGKLSVLKSRAYFEL